MRMAMLSRLIPDRFVLLLLGAVLFGWLLPVSGQGLTIAQDVSFVSIFALFFLHGLRLPRQEVVKAARSWKVQGAMLVFSFVAMPLAGLALVKGAGWMLPAALATGLVYCAMLPSTVQSAISYSSMGGGNVAASVVGAAMQPGEAFDFAVFDEAHKTAGREGRNFAFALDERPHPPTELSANEQAQLQARRGLLTAHAAALVETRSPSSQHLGWMFDRLADLGTPPALPPPDPTNPATPSHDQVLSAAIQLADSWDPVSRPSSFLWRDPAHPQPAAHQPQKLLASVGRLPDQPRTTQPVLHSTARALTAAPPPRRSAGWGGPGRWPPP